MSQEEWVLEEVSKLSHDKKQINLLKEGSYVKLVFKMRQPIKDVYAERMWVKVTKATSSRYVGILDNDPKYIKTLHDGDEIEFTDMNILEIGDF